MNGQNLRTLPLAPALFVVRLPYSIIFVWNCSARDSFRAETPNKVVINASLFGNISRYITYHSTGRSYLHTVTSCKFFVFKNKTNTYLHLFWWI